MLSIQYTGGLVGSNDSSTANISNSYATGSVTGDDGNNNDTGGLVGINMTVWG